MAELAELQFKTTEKYSQACIDEILRIAVESGLTAERILDHARDINSPLHSLFDWDDSSAAQKYRLHQARIVINEIKVVIEEVEYPAFENVKVAISEGETERLYKPRPDILKIEDYRRQMIRKALGQMTYWKKQYESYSELQPIFLSVEQTKEKIESEWDKEPH